MNLLGMKLLETLGNLGMTALDAAAQSQRPKKHRGKACLPCEARGNVYNAHVNAQRFTREQRKR